MAKSRPSRGQVREIVREQLAELNARGRFETDAQPGLSVLHDQLVGAAKAYRTGPLEQRQAVCDALIAVAEFLKGQGFNSATLEPLNRVLQAISDLCLQNNPDPLFCQKQAKTKPRRDLADALRQGHLAALANAWVESATSEEGNEAAILDCAARHMSGPHFGKLDRTALSSARSYQRQMGHNDLIYRAHDQMRAILLAEAEAIGGGTAGLREAVTVQIKALNIKAKLRRP